MAELLHVTPVQISHYENNRNDIKVSVIKELAEKLSNEHDDFNFRYIDIHAEGITKADLEKTVGKPVETVPQIFVDQKHIGGCTDFEAWAKENMNLFA